MGQCEEPGCSNPTRTRTSAKCNGCYLRAWRARGHRVRKCRPDDPRWKGDEAGYKAIHDRLRRYRGRPDQFTCPCGKQATQWSYDHTDPNPKHAQVWDGRGSGRTLTVEFSVDLDRYVALCASDHGRLDRAWRKAQQKKAA